ncbi:hypothetical protein [Pontibacillus marinus]|uniref:Uncharacterized protein n=1 Tax=Pontibacillus marinus BH030004 = DSM 16465 TaxID=1385511 RepID=A0A0A5I2Y7_9BACI|nr:hypothetical protein [Pontibacillus marinus]KGX90207.1 hypothetical protein N783_01560 [Pontibacillus marinus BH030004 = DSM 16465]
MDLKLIENENELRITIYNGVCLNEYQDLAKRWNEMLSFVHHELLDYIHDDSLCFDDSEDSFPVRSKLTGNYYINSVSYINHVNPVGYQIMIETRLTEHIPTGEDDYLGLEVTLFTRSVNHNFEVWSIDSSSI